MEPAAAQERPFRDPRPHRQGPAPTFGSGRLTQNQVDPFTGEARRVGNRITKPDTISSSFENAPESVRSARVFIADRLASHGVSEEIPLLVVSELATNVVRHAQTPFTVGLSIDDSTIRIEVEDGAGAMKVASDLASDRGGYGIQLVEAFSTSWGVEVRGDRKAVWVELPAQAE